jgi:hypothetical protein
MPKIQSVTRRLRKAAIAGDFSDAKPQYYTAVKTTADCLASAFPIFCTANLPGT